MKLKRRWISIFSVSSLFLFGNVAANEARDIMQKVIDRDDGHSQYSLQSIATCKYEIKKQKMSCRDKPRIKLLEMVQKDSGKNDKDSQSVMIIKKPSSEKGIGFLQYDYDESGKDTDQWMYLSALGKIKRIVSGNDNEPKKGSLFGSEFAYEDTEKVKLEDYNYRLIKEVVYKGITSWIIESTPTPQQARKSNYSKLISWIDKQRYLSLKTKIYDRRGRLIKQLLLTQHKKIDGVWIAQKLNMNNVQTKRISTMKLNKVVLNIQVDDTFLTQRILTDSVFREKQLNKIRVKIK